MFNQIAGTYECTNAILSLGLHTRWYKKLTRAIPPWPGLRAIDLATGTGQLARAVAKRKNVSQVVGVDLARKMLSLARQKEAPKVQFLEGDALNLPFAEGSFDVATISFGIRNFSDPGLGLSEALRVLRPGGKLLILEFGLPPRPWGWFYLLYLRHFLPAIGGAISQNRRAYRYLNQTVESFPYGKDFLALLKRHQFERPKARALSFGACYLYEAYRPCGPI